jgi:uncharacterized protein
MPYTDLGDLADQRYISLTTRRRDDSLVSTPVWAVSDNGRRLLIWTGQSTWKVKRIRNNAKVFVAPCDFRGRERGPRIEATARLLPAAAEDVVVPLLRRKYGWQRRLLELQGWLRRGPAPTSVYIELT